MKPVFIQFTDHEGKVTRTYSVVSLKTGITDNIFDIAERAEQMEAATMNMSEVRSFFRDLKALIVSAFGGQFSYDELNEGVDQDELMNVFQKLCENMMGDMQKNSRRGKSR